MAMGNFGERLKREREMREVTLAEITAATRIGTRFLEALENEDWRKLPGGVFNRGFVRAVAHYLGLDEESLLGEYDLARADQAAAAPPPVENRIPPLPRWLPALAVLGILIVLAGLFAAGRYGWRRYSAHRAARHAAAATLHVPPQSPPPLAAASAPAAAPIPLSAATSTPLQLSISTSAAARVRILADDKVILDAELGAGENRHFSASRQFEIFATDSSAVLLELNGQAMPPIGAPGSSGTIVLSQKDLRQAPNGNTQP